MQLPQLRHTSNPHGAADPMSSSLLKARVHSVHRSERRAISDNRQMVNGDIVAEPQSDGRYKIRRWHADGRLMPIEGHDDLYDEEEMYRRLNRLRATGDTYVRDSPMVVRLIQP
jgi:hypothetical protein